MQNIRDIMKIANVDQAQAFRIFDKMCATGLDFSECTNKEFLITVTTVSLAMKIMGE